LGRGKSITVGGVQLVQHAATRPRLLGRGKTNRELAEISLK
jgi:hypothetical protein